MTSEHDKREERARFDDRARVELARASSGAPAAVLGSAQIPAYLRAPYLRYEQAVRRLLRPGLRALELGSGTGVQTGILIESGAEVVASDIAPSALEVLQGRWRSAGPRLSTAVADMERLPFADASFDLVVSAGSLSYGDPDRVDREVRRVLRPGGALVVVDSLNHHPIYRLNRWIQWFRGLRSRSTIERMPTLDRIAALGRGFDQTRVEFFGAATFAMPLVARVLGPEAAARLSDRIDGLFGTRRAAFKFVLVAQVLRPMPNGSNEKAKL